MARLPDTGAKCIIIRKNKKLERLNRVLRRIKAKKQLQSPAFAHSQLESGYGFRGLGPMQHARIIY